MQTRQKAQRLCTKSPECETSRPHCRRRLQPARAAAGRLFEEPNGVRPRPAEAGVYAAPYTTFSAKPLAAIKKMTGPLVWLRFNAVGLLGIGVQLFVLTILKSGWGLNYLAATVIAVESAVLHNFVWHERWTWFERTRQNAGGVSDRLLRFHLANGVISIAGNLGLMWLLVSRLNLHYFLANIAAVATCSILNFLASDRLVFRREHSSGIHR